MPVKKFQAWERARTKKEQRLLFGRHFYEYFWVLFPEVSALRADYGIFRHFVFLGLVILTKWSQNAAALFFNFTSCLKDTELYIDSVSIFGALCLLSQ